MYSRTLMTSGTLEVATQLVDYYANLSAYLFFILNIDLKNTYVDIKY